MPVPPLRPPSPSLGCEPGSGTTTTRCPRRPLKSQFRLLPPPDSRTHPGGDLIHCVAPRVSLGLGDSVETGQVGTPLPGRGHPPATSAAAACRGPSGNPAPQLSRFPAAAKRRGGGGSTAAPPAHSSASGLAEKLPGQTASRILGKENLVLYSDPRQDPDRASRRGSDGRTATLIPGEICDISTNSPCALTHF